MRTKSIYLVLSLFIVLIAGCGKEKVFLNYELQEGKTYSLKMESEQEIQQTVLNQTIGMNTSMDMTMKYKVKSISDSVYNLEVSYDEMSMRMELPQGTVEYNSETDDSTDVLGSVMKKLSGMKFTVKMKKTGKIISIEGLSELVEQLTQGFPGDHDQYKSQMDQMMKNYLSEDAVSRNLSMGVPVFPEEGVSQGEEWEFNTEMKSFLSGELNTTYKLEELNPSEAVISGDAFFDVETDSADLMMTGVELNYNISGPVKSRYVINLENGWIEEGSIDQELNGTVSMAPTDQMPEGMNIEMSIKSKLHLQGKVE